METSTEAEWEWMADPSDTNKHLLLNEVKPISKVTPITEPTPCVKRNSMAINCATSWATFKRVWDVAAPYPIEEVINPLGGLVDHTMSFEEGLGIDIRRMWCPRNAKTVLICFENNDLGFRLVRSIDSEE